MTTPEIISPDSAHPDGPEIGVGDFMHVIQMLAGETTPEGDPRPVAAGTFALYPMPDGGLMFVTDVPEGVLAGTKHTKISPALIRAAATLAGGGSKLSAVKALVSRRGK
jgi:hypothetical protein